MTGKKTAPFQKTYMTESYNGEMIKEKHICGRAQNLLGTKSKDGLPQALRR
jgi:hypothetical protein